MSFTVAIVGRPNVGKSTLFNRLIEQRKAIVDDESGVTRDRQYGLSEWGGKKFFVVDTGGYVENGKMAFEKQIATQVKLAIEEAQVLILMTDAAVGITELDEAMASLLRGIAKPVLLCVNKVDNGNRLLEAADFYKLGFKHIFFISSITGSGTGELLDQLIALSPADSFIEEETTLPKIAIIGQPNVGKSSLLNALLGKERTIVSPIAGTTRDTIHTRYTLYQKDFILIDTAGIRRKAKVNEDIEFYSVIRAIKAIDEADVCLLLIDASKGLTAQDLTIFSNAEKKGKGIVLIVNKWDLIPKETNTAKDLEAALKIKLAPFNDVPIVFISVTEKLRILKAIEWGLKVFENRTQKIATSKLNEVVSKAIESHPAPSFRGSAIKINYANQLPTAVPSFAFFCNHPKEIKQPYKNYLENQLRKNFNFTGVPLRLFFRDK